MTTDRELIERALAAIDKAADELLIEVAILQSHLADGRVELTNAQFQRFASTLGGVGMAAGSVMLGDLGRTARREDAESEGE
jgi:hypothetical protein